ncbi:MAG: c-type cytochrome [Usitatibacter sp.]
MKILKSSLAVLAATAGLAIAAFSGALWMGERKLERTVDVRVVPVPYTRDPRVLVLGKYLFDTRGCAECHGALGAGKVFVDDPKTGMVVRGPNITSGGVTAAYSEADWVRAVRHGIAPSGRALMVMPSEDYNRFNDADFAALVAYVRSLPPASTGGAVVKLPAIVRALYGAGMIKDASEKIDHKLPPSPPVAVAVSVEHGGYVANMCIGCHGAGLSGGNIPGGPPDWPAAANITPGEGSAMTQYDTPKKFAAMMRTGKRPDGSGVSKVMPFDAFRNLNDTDLQAMHAFLKTVPPRKAGGR